MTKRSSFKPILREQGEIAPWEVGSLPRPVGDSGQASLANTVGNGRRKPLTQLFQSGRDAEITQAESAVETARLQASAILEVAREQGLRDGREQAAKELESEKQELVCLIEQLEASFTRFCQSQAPNLAELAIKAAEQVVREQLTLEPERVAAIVNHALEHITASTHITIHLHPDDLRIVRDCIANHELRQSANIELRSEPAMEQGGCWIDSEQGEVDATVAGRLARLSVAVGEL